MNDPESPLMRWLWPLLASLAGAITALSFRPWADMGKGEIGLALFVGASFAMFVAPIAVHAVYGNGPVDIRTVGGLFYLLASGSNILIPAAVKRLSSQMGYREPKE